MPPGEVLLWERRDTLLAWVALDAALRRAALAVPSSCGPASGNVSTCSRRTVATVGRRFRDRCIRPPLNPAIPCNPAGFSPPLASTDSAGQGVRPVPGRPWCRRRGADNEGPSWYRRQAADVPVFIEKAREIGADEDKSAADDLLGQLAKKPPEPKHKS
jgi:hypothetical protein